MGAGRAIRPAFACGRRTQRCADSRCRRRDGHPQRPLEITELAAVAGTSATALRAAFRAELGTSPREYVRGVRLARAHAELADGYTGALAALAHRWGFADVRRFASAYEERYGEGPRGQT